MTASVKIYDNIREVLVFQDFRENKHKGILTWENGVHIFFFELKVIWSVIISVLYSQFNKLFSIPKYKII